MLNRWKINVNYSEHISYSTTWLIFNHMYFPRIFKYQEQMIYIWLMLAICHHGSFNRSFLPLWNSWLYTELIYTRCYQFVKPSGHGDIIPTICAYVKKKNPTVTVFFVSEKSPFMARMVDWHQRGVLRKIERFLWL